MASPAQMFLINEDELLKVMEQYRQRHIGRKGITNQMDIHLRSQISSSPASYLLLDPVLDEELSQLSREKTQTWTDTTRGLTVNVPVVADSMKDEDH